jgi:hypothetical protein
MVASLLTDEYIYSGLLPFVIYIMIDDLTFDLPSIVELPSVLDFSGSLS